MVLLDLTLPDSNGLETIDRLRELLPRLPLVVLTGLSDEEVAIEAVRRSAQDYLLKGQIDAPSLARTLRYAIDRAGAAGPPAGPRRSGTEGAGLHGRAVPTEPVPPDGRSHAPVIIWAVDLEGTCLLADGKLESIGLTPGQAVGRKMAGVVDERCDVAEHIRQAAKGQEAASEVDFGGKIFELRCSAIRDEGGRTTGVLLVWTDITERRQTERESMNTVEQEQRRIGQDIHDTIQGNLARSASCWAA